MERDDGLGRGLGGAEFPERPPLSDLLPPSFLRHSRCAPLLVEGDVLTLAIEDPLDGFTPVAVASKAGLTVALKLARSGDLDAWLKLLPEDGAPAEEAQGLVDDALTLDVERLRDRASDAPVVRLVNAMIDRAIETKASDIRLTASRAGSRLRYRVDGILRDAEPPGQGLGGSRLILIQANLYRAQIFGDTFQKINSSREVEKCRSGLSSKMLCQESWDQRWILCSLY